jgi:membrane protein DedA with SNARE-associated domain
MFESLLAKYGYIAILLGTVFEGETIMIMGGFSAHRGYLKLLPWVILAGFMGNFIQNQVYLELIMGEIKHLEVPILVGIAVIGGLWLFFNRRRRSKSPVIQNF